MKLGEGILQDLIQIDALSIRESRRSSGSFAGVHAVVKQTGTPIMFAARSRERRQKVTEIETMVVRNQAEGIIFQIAAAQGRHSCNEHHT